MESEQRALAYQPPLQACGNHRQGNRRSQHLPKGYNRTPRASAKRHGVWDLFAYKVRGCEAAFRIRWPYSLARKRLCNGLPREQKMYRTLTEGQEKFCPFIGNALNC